MLNICTHHIGSCFQRYLNLNLYLDIWLCSEHKYLKSPIMVVKRACVPCSYNEGKGGKNRVNINLVFDFTFSLLCRPSPEPECDWRTPTSLPSVLHLGLLCWRECIPSGKLGRTRPKCPLVTSVSLDHLTLETHWGLHKDCWCVIPIHWEHLDIWTHVKWAAMDLIPNNWTLFKQRGSGG